MEKIDLQDSKNSDKIGKEIYDLIKELYPICRSITGNGVRETLKIIKQHIPLEILEIPSGTKVFDWEIPKEWNINDAYIKNSKGEKIIDFKKSNLHVLNYSIPIHKKILLSELKEHVFTLPDHPNWIPYRTSYYKENWGFCMTHNQFQNLKDEQYEVVIDSRLENGNLTYGEIYLEGEMKDEVLLTCYVCHPSMCNDNLSGVALLTYLAKELIKIKRNLSYRFLFIPETIGAITWLSKNEDKVRNIKHGLVATCLGDSGKMTYKRSRDGNNTIDQVVTKVLKESQEPFEIIDFFPTGSDERQFCSPGFNLPIGSLMRTRYTKFLEYHTSGDDLDFVQPKFLKNSFEKYYNVIRILEEQIEPDKSNTNKSNKNKSIKNKSIKKESENVYVNIISKCEPHLGKRGLYRNVGGSNRLENNILTKLWILNLADGNNSVEEMASRSEIDLEEIILNAKILEKEGLIKFKRRN